MSDSPASQWKRQQTEMIAQLRRYGIRNAAILKVMADLPRHRFIPESCRNEVNSYGDHPCSIGFGQTISQPYIVAYMTEKLELAPGERVLEVGTGSAYQAAVLARLGVTVFTVERIPELVQHARAVLREESIEAVQVIEGDGYDGLPEHAPFDAVMVTCAPDDVPDNLAAQLAEGGRMMIPLGAGPQQLVLLRKTNGRIRRTNDIMVRFVPMVRSRAANGD